jgi:polysaccharide export outer membrane protein
VKIIRKTPQGMSETPVELKKILQAKADDIPMQADDILFVPTSASKIAGKRAVDAAVQMATAVSIFAVR